MVKVSIVGDMMCEPLLLNASKHDREFDFSPVFSNVRELFSQSDFVIGNLETPIAGEKAGYVNRLFSFNAPKEFAMAAKEAGISLVSTANNHCMDRGFDGLLETVKNLDEIGLEHIGTCAFPEKNERVHYQTIDGQTIAVIAYTYGTNYLDHHRALTPEQEKHINLLRPYFESVYMKRTEKRTLADRVINKVLRCFDPEKRTQIKKALGMKYNSPRKDDAVNLETAAPYLEQFKEDIRNAKENANIVIVLPHVGGQFNLEPGAFTELVIQAAREAGADAIIASHPHIVQKAEMKNGIPCFYSIGNFSMSPNSVYLLHENLPEYGVVVNLYIENKKIVQTTFSVLKIIEPRGKTLTVYPVDQLAAKTVSEGELAQLRVDVAQIYSVVTGDEASADIEIQREYLLAEIPGGIHC